MWIFTYTNVPEKTYKSFQYRSNKEANEMLDVLLNLLQEDGYFCYPFNGESLTPLWIVYSKGVVVGTLSVTKLDN